ncbi:PR domain zinc finger protein 4 isoform X1 [Hemiscyllium ocellatum]|uniref:PR domain zinc finger protein 4 isoform X1 n=2 Tax=Hemiscyllium ocellatum TaxID=170820 RepID=UPI002966CDB1|nr:PR domain zinc finger protein 4 isoform X1 [Hemiscyllium ocellatum]
MGLDGYFCSKNLLGSDKPGDNFSMNDINLSPVGMDQLNASSVSSTLPVTGSHLGMGSPTHNPLPAPGMPVAIPNLSPSLGSLPSALSLMLPMSIGERGVMCSIPERNYTLPPPPYPHLENSYFRHILPGILSYLADRPPPQYIHSSAISVDGNPALPVSSNPPTLDHYEPNGAVGLESSIVSIDSRHVGTHNSQNLHQSNNQEVPLNANISMETVSRVNSPISTEGMSEDLTMNGVTGKPQALSSGSRNHETITVDSVGNNLEAEAVGQNTIIPIHANAIELPVVMEPEQITGRVNNMPENSLSDSIHAATINPNPVGVALSSSHSLPSLESVSLHGSNVGLDRVSVSTITTEVSMRTNQVDGSSENLSFVSGSLQMEDSCSNKENLADSFTIWCTVCDRAYPADCPEHGAVTFIPDTPVSSRARLSIPKQLSLRQSITGEDVGVWSQETIPIRTCFGPLIGEEINLLEVADWTNKSNTNIWKIFCNYVLEFLIVTADENICNWMMFVHRARTREEQNLVAYPHNGKIYFCTSKEIPPNHELLFYYTRDYARQLGVPEHPNVHMCHCGKAYGTYSELKSHLSSHGQSRERKWKCSICPRAFTSSTKLNVHMMGHMGMKPHKCEFCSKAFSDPSNLRTHLKIHTGQKNYRCEMCDKSFTQKAHLASHMIIHTGEKNLKCDYCEKMFMRRQDLRQHMLTHTQERQIKCPNCDKLFWRTTHLKKHLNSHEGRRDFICEKCSKAYLTKYHLTRHLKICKGSKTCLPMQDLEEEDEDEDVDSEDEELLESGRGTCQLNNDNYATEEDGQ